MSTEMVRLNITLPSSIAEELNQCSVPRKRSQFIAEAITMRIRQLKKDSKGKADQIRTIDKARLIKPIGKLTRGLMENMDKAIKIHLLLDSE